MNFLITGGTGFIGSKLCSRLQENKHDVVIMTRHPEMLKGKFSAITELEQINDGDTFDVVINLAGEPIANKYWSKLQKQRILDSRLNTTRKLIAYFKTSNNRPKLFISASAIGYYGVGVTSDNLNEEALGDESFSSQLCQQWEAIALEAKTLGIRTCVLRTGIVLGKEGGALKKMSLPFKLGLGGKIGKGKQWMSWIHLDDLIGIILYCIEHDNVNGAVNGTAPDPVTNKRFTTTLGKVLNRPTKLPIPAIVVQLLMGQMGKELLLSGKKVLPDKITKEGYIFKYAKLEDALSNSV